MKGTKWIELVLGVWVLVSPWVLAADLMQTSNIIAGVLVILVACVGLFSGKSNVSQSPQM